MDKVWEDVTKKAKLISLPDVYLRLKSVLEDPDFTMAEVAVVISQDPAITLRLLRIVNSSLYGFSSKIETVSRAVGLLGTQQIHDLVLTTCVAQAFEGMTSDVMDMYRFWKRSVYCAVSSRQLAVLCSVYDKERIFVAGLLHDIGHLVMYQVVPDLCQHAILEAKKTSRPLHEVERALIGFDYAKAGAELMQHWNIPQSLQETTRLHILPEKAKKYALETSLVHLGALLARADEQENIFNEGMLTVAPSAWVVTGLSPNDCFSLHDKIEEEMEEVIQLIFQ